MEFSLCIDSIYPEDGLKEKTDPYTHEFIKKYLEDVNEKIN